MKTALAIVLTAVTLAGCQNRTVWEDNGSLEQATKERKIWDAEGQMDSGGERTFWKNREGEDVIK